MVKITKVYTRTGDTGQTGLVEESGFPKIIRVLKLMEASMN